MDGWKLKTFGRSFDQYPNVMTEIGAVLAELGRQPHTARQFLIDYGDRILFGKDSYNETEYHIF